MKSIQKQIKEILEALGADQNLQSQFLEKIKNYKEDQQKIILRVLLEQANKNARELKKNTNHIKELMKKYTQTREQVEHEETMLEAEQELQNL